LLVIFKNKLNQKTDAPFLIQWEREKERELHKLNTGDLSTPLS